MSVGITDRKINLKHHTKTESEMKLSLTVEVSTAFKSFCCSVVLFFLIFLLPSNCDAQKKWSLDINVGILQPVGKDVEVVANPVGSTYISYYSKKKYTNLYYGFLPNLNYYLSSRLALGVQSGIYLHPKETYTGYKPLQISVPLIATARYRLAKFKSTIYGALFGVGRTFFQSGDVPFYIKNGWLFNVAAYAILKNKHVFKVGFDKEINDGFIYYSSGSNDPSNLDAILKHKITRNALFISYGITIN
jgi:hypothetical protein